MNFLRAVARECGVPVSLLRDMVQCVGSRLLSCHCGVDFLWPGRYAGYCARDTVPLLIANRRSGAPGRTVGEVVDNF